LAARACGKTPLCSLSPGTDKKIDYIYNATVRFKSVARYIFNMVRTDATAWRVGVLGVSWKDSASVGRIAYPLKG